MIRSRIHGFDRAGPRPEGEALLPTHRLAARAGADADLGGDLLRLPGPAAGLGERPRLVEDRALGRLHHGAAGVGRARAPGREDHRPRLRHPGLRRRRPARRGAAGGLVADHRALAVLRHLDRPRRRHVGDALRGLFRGADPRHGGPGQAGDYPGHPGRRLRRHGLLPERRRAGGNGWLARRRRGLRRGRRAGRGAPGLDRLPPGGAACGQRGARRSTTA